MLLFQKRDGWIVWSADERVRITPPAPAAGERPVHLVSTPEQGVDFVFHEPERGFSALPVSERRR